MRGSVLYLFLLILESFFDLISDTVYKCNRLPKVFLEKSFKFILYRGCGPITFDPGFILLLAKVDPISEE